MSSLQTGLGILVLAIPVSDSSSTTKAVALSQDCQPVLVSMGSENPRSTNPTIDTIIEQCATFVCSDQNVLLSSTSGETSILGAPPSLGSSKAPAQTVEVSTPSAQAPNPLPSTKDFSSHPNPKSWVDTVKSSIDKSLKRYGPPSSSSTGKPRVKICDVVFHRRADMHKEFLVGYFLGKTPSYNLIQSVLSQV